ncbi:hypothetical protein COT99_01390 [Candidatus Falkowbacteria bacterium CG10_big_fil_rev_8_21_14_0_10_43_10]|uniref:Uncharacterized protein n=1 Tax=Candidatus Falkowbacteria bacterium CG10_big_fil_rev_8_21_14_0_10_43_10 TaxID=1974567 RepID=A0A2H0V2J7_9BACT|nr:MAG: hypothetical protein COT99_01390 [Candidatus Falkowbacteria bacterium CG10_big_fil_rev_8_21_14_0_10_43_10]
MKKRFLIPLGIILMPVTALLAALLTEKINGTFVSGWQFLIIAVIAIIAAIILVMAVKLPKFIAGAIVVGLLLSPYFQFMFGKINVFLMDPPDLRPSVSVPEVRVEMGDLIFTNDAGRDIVVLPSSGVKTLYPGKNVVNLGQMDIPAGTYKSGKMSVKNIEVDVNVDLKKEIDLMYDTFKSQYMPPLPADMPEEAKAMIPGDEEIKQRIGGEIGKYLNAGMIAPYLPPFVKIKSFSQTADTIAMVLSAAIDLPVMPIAFPYPTGTGGPDIVLDITLNAIGLPTGITPIIKLPPGAPDISSMIPDMTPNIGNINMPTDFNIPAAALEQIKREVEAGVAQGEAIKQQMMRQP